METVFLFFCSFIHRHGHDSTVVAPRDDQRLGFFQVILELIVFAGENGVQENTENRGDCQS